MNNKFLSFLFCIFFALANAQEITGVVLDKNTRLPIESASIYFDNTTVGTSTNLKGEFSIPFKEEIKSPLIISFLGYKDVIIGNYKTGQHLEILLEEAADNLDEVLINYDDGLTRTQKLRLFRKEFLGFSKFASSCKILNEENLILRYNSEDEILSASSKAPIIIENKMLQYQIEYDLIDFEIHFKYANLLKQEFSVKGVSFSGTTFFKNLEKAKSKRVNKNRVNVYKGSVQHFMKSLYNSALEKNGYLIAYNGYKVDPWKHIKVESIENSEWKKVEFSEKLTILFENDEQSNIQLSSQFFYVDKYGNYSPIQNVLFSGVMGNQRLGDTLPLDFNLDKE